MYKNYQIRHYVVLCSTNFPCRVRIQGRPQVLAGGGPRFFFQIWKYACRIATCAHGEAMSFARGFGGMLPREFFFKWCNLVRFGVYFDQILSLKNFKNYHFLYKNFKNCNFYYFLYKNLKIVIFTIFYIKI